MSACPRLQRQRALGSRRIGTRPCRSQGLPIPRRRLRHVHYQDCSLPGLGSLSARVAKDIQRVAEVAIALRHETLFVLEVLAEELRTATCACDGSRLALGWGARILRLRCTTLRTRGLADLAIQGDDILTRYSRDNPHLIFAPLEQGRGQKLRQTALRARGRPLASSRGDDLADCVGSDCLSTPN